MIKELPISGFNDKLDNSTLNYPNSTNPNAPRLFFNLLSVASRNSGKTYTLVKLIKDYESHKKFKENKKYFEYQEKLCDLIDSKKIV